MVKVGLIVNPIAGMGGKVGLKGTDGAMYGRALALGAKPVSPGRIGEVLRQVERKDLQFLAAPGPMGADYLEKAGYACEIVGEIGPETDSGDTKRLARAMVEKGVAVLVFVGGDGTARDILDAVGMEVPVIAIPSGVKMFSSVFVFSPSAAAEMINRFGEAFTEKEVLDIDEDAFRENRLDARYYGTVRVPDLKGLLQGKKAASNVKPASGSKKMEVARFVVEHMEDGWVYLLGPGTTVKAITDALGLEKTLLGIDAVCDKALVGMDINEQDILGLLERYGRMRIVVTPIGGNGFIFGRGSRQISAEVLRRVGKENILIVSTLDKVGGLACLRIDSGDREVDMAMSGRVEVLIGCNETMVMEVKA